MRGRLLAGNLVPAARRNYGNVVNGPWVFGLVQKRTVDGKIDARFFVVQRRDAATLIPIIQRHVAPGILGYMLLAHHFMMSYSRKQ